MIYKVESIEVIDDLRKWLTLSDKDGHRIEKVGFAGKVAVGDFINGNITNVKQNDKVYSVFKKETEPTEAPKQETKQAPKQEQKTGYDLRDERIARQGFINQAIQILPYMKNLKEWALLIEKLEPVYIRYVIKGELNLQELKEDKNE